MSELTINNEQATTSRRDKLVYFLINQKSLFLLILLCIGAQIASSGLFMTGSNISSVIRQTSVTCLMALGFTCVLSCGNLDLSVGHMLSLLSMSYVMLAGKLPLSIAIFLTICVGIGCGFINGFLAIKLGLIPFVLTLATAQIWRGIAYLLCNGISLPVSDKSMKFIGQGIVLGFIPMTAIIVFIMAVIISVMIYRTKFGRHILATGGNAEAARVSGVNIIKTKWSTFMIMGICNAVAAVVISGRIGIAMPSVGDGMEMDAIAAVVIGGTTMSGGKANVFGSICGGLIMGIISNLLNLAGVSSFWQWLAKGIIIIIAIYVDKRTEMFFNSAKRKGRN